MRRRYRYEHRDRRIADVRSSSRTSIKVPPARSLRAGNLPTVLPAELARQGQTGQQIQVLRRLPVKLIHGLDCTKTMPTSVPAAPDLTFRFVPPGAPAGRGNYAAC